MKQFLTRDGAWDFDVETLGDVNEEGGGVFEYFGFVMKKE